MFEFNQDPYIHNSLSHTQTHYRRFRQLNAILHRSQLANHVVAVKPKKDVEVTEALCATSHLAENLAISKI